MGSHFEMMVWHLAADEPDGGTTSLHIHFLQPDRPWLTLRVMISGTWGRRLADSGEQIWMRRLRNYSIRSRTQWVKKEGEIEASTSIYCYWKCS